MQRACRLLRQIDRKGDTAWETGTSARDDGRVIEVALDQSKVGQHIASQMEAIEADYGDDSEIGDICTIVEIRGPHGSHVRMRSTASSPHSTLGLLKLAEQVALANFGRDDV